MPAETRKIVFSTAEVQAALVNYALRSDIRLPHSPISNMLIAKGEDGLSATLKYAPSDDGESRDIEFSEPHLAAAIILFCRVHEMPLPRDARKVLLPEDDALAMLMKIEHEDKIMAEPNSAGRELRETAESEAAATHADAKIDAAHAAVDQSGGN